MSSPGMKPDTVLGGRFRMIARAGRGGMGEVWRARDLQLDAEVAVKLLLDGAATRSRFAQEALLLDRVRHPALVGYVAHDFDAARPWLAMTWVDGETLEARLVREPLTLDQALQLGRRIAGALGALHAAGIVHRDVKPSNVMLPGGRPEAAMLLDLGIARDSLGRGGLTGTNLIIGTIGYMSPEQARAGRDVDSRADVFSLGCVLYECVTGVPAYPGDNAIAVLARLLTAAPPGAASVRPGLPDDVDALLTAFLDPLADGRPADGRAALAALESLGAPSSLHTRTTALRTTLGSRSHAEQRFALAIVVDLGGDLEAGATLEPGALETELLRVRDAAAVFGATVTPLGATRLLVVARERGTAADRAAASAALARAIVAAVPGARVGLAAGLASSALPAGEVLERAACLARDAPGGEVRVDSVATDLIGERFEIREGALGQPRREGPSRPVLGRVAPFVGREKELALLEGIVAEAIEESAPRVALVLAPPGTGKSRLARELAVRLAARGGVRLVVGHAEAASAGTSHAILRVAIRAAAGLEAASRDHARVQAYVQDLGAPHGDRLADFLGEIAGAPRTGEPGPELLSSRGDPELMARWTRRTVCDWLAAEAARGPFVLVLEDLHWADEATLLHLGEALRSVRRLPLVIVALARPEVAELLRDPWPEVSEVRLGGLGARAAERLVRDLLGRDFDPAVVARILERAGGNPLFLEELVRFVADGRSDELPATVLAVLDARLAQLEPEVRWVLRAASVLGERVDPGGVAAVAERPRELVDASLAALVRAEILERLPDEGACLFRHGLVRDAAHATLPAAEARAAHLRAADWLEREIGSPSPWRMIHHLEQAGEEARLVPWLTAAAWESSEAGADREAFRLAERALALGASGVEEGRLALLSALRACSESDYAVAAGAAAVARERIPTSDPQWLLAAGLGAWAAALRGQADEVRAITAAWLAAKVQVTRGRLSYMAGYGTVTPLSAFGQIDAARVVLAQVQPPRRPDIAEAAFYWAMRASHGIFALGRMGEAITFATRGRDVALRSEDRFAVALCEQWRCLAMNTFTSSARAVAETAASLERVRSLGFEHATLFVDQLLCQARAATDDAALEELRGQAHGGATGVRGVFASIYLVSLLLRRGRLEEAAQAIGALAGPLSVGFGRWTGVMLAARVDLLRGDPSGALARLDAAPESSRSAWLAEWIQVTRIEALLALGDGEQAAAAATGALEQYASSIDGADEETRAYVEVEVEPVARLLGLAGRLGLAAGRRLVSAP